jgi:hypothetical protein
MGLLVFLATARAALEEATAGHRRIFAEKLRENDLATVHVRPKRYAELDRFAPFVVSVKITPIEKQR